MADVTVTSNKDITITGATWAEVIGAFLASIGEELPDFGPNEADSATVSVRIGATGELVGFDFHNSTINVALSDKE